MSIRPYRRIEKAHWDDIHGFIYNRGRIISGSKDGSLKFWNANGELLNSFESSNKGYKFWVTALENFDDGHFAVGTRDGTITVFDMKDEVVFNANNVSDQTFPKPISKKRNQQRIDCIKQLNERGKPHFFYVGVARNLQLWNLRDKKFIRSFKASDNDWVYCIEPFRNGDLIVVIGSTLEYWKKINNSYFQKTSIIQETLEERKSKQRPHISSIVRLQKDQNILAASLFTGHVKLIDIDTQRVIKTFSEHEGRVWSVSNVNSYNFASSADDRTIKIWDVRQNSSVLTLSGNPGRVSSLMKLDEGIFISGSCPDKVFNSEEKASISFWDIRKAL
ncbi:MAG: hypothetical protein KR126chlam4_00407 [Candidatus Anoxychlamydiales bacterium]|nr:hypothetical protein [Candidatus Anoxychlamydiales bacterium]NGX40585.1 hypothetical protein [Candidatus Anoxychlamydiales bacterium]HEU64285.1 hypothetical protein [Chlamydiota bacterium]